jgi:hypothetical protein
MANFKVWRIGAVSSVVFAALVVALGASQVQAAAFLPVTTVVAPGTILVDEFGTGLFTPPGAGTVPLPHDGPDPTPGGLVGVLSYTLPVAVVPGDVNLFEPPSTTALSDVIRFVGASLFFYSDVGPGDLAETPFDLGLPVGSLPVVVSHAEIGAEGALNGVDYIPAAGDPGFDPSGIVVGYHFVSDIPEPASLGLMLIGGAALLLRRRR